MGRPVFAGLCLSSPELWLWLLPSGIYSLPICLPFLAKASWVSLQTGHWYPQGSLGVQGELPTAFGRSEAS